MFNKCFKIDCEIYFYNKILKRYKYYLYFVYMLSQI
jgi:hypothetical protein